MGKTPRSLLNRMGLAVLTGMFLITALLVQGWLADQSARLVAQERLTAELQRQLGQLQQEREDLEDEHERLIALAHDWLRKVAIPRATILQTARRDAADSNQVDLDKCFAIADLEADGWNVSCRLDRGLDDPMIIYYVIDPLTGQISSKRVVKGSDRKP